MCCYGKYTFFLARNKRFGGLGGRLIRTGLCMKQGSYVFSVWIFRMRKRAQRMSIFKRNSINSNVQQNLPITNHRHCRNTKLHTAKAPFTRRRCENDRYKIVPIRKEIFPDRRPVYTKTIRIRKLLKTIRTR